MATVLKTSLSANGETELVLVQTATQFVVTSLEKRTLTNGRAARAFTTRKAGERALADELLYCNATDALEAADLSND